MVQDRQNQLPSAADLNDDCQPQQNDQLLCFEARSRHASGAAFQNRSRVAGRQSPRTFAPKLACNDRCDGGDAALENCSNVSQKMAIRMA